jgi:hypothetical protein
MKKSNIVKLTTTAVFGVIALAAQPAKADMITYDLLNGNSALQLTPPDTGPTGFATITVDLQNPTTAVITFNSTVNGPYANLFGDGGSAGLNVNGGFSIDSITGTAAAGFQQATYSSGGAGNEDGFGSFNLTVNSNDGFGHCSTQIVISLTGSWTDAADVLTANAGGSVAAAHIFVTADPANPANGAINTGFAATGLDTPEVPDGGSTLIMLGCALVGVAKARACLTRA